VVDRVLAWEGCLNVRDLGGHATEDGGETRVGAIVRADSVRQLSDRGWQALADHGVRLAVDLRWPEELAQDPPRNVDIDVVHISVLGPSFDQAVDYFRTLDAHVDEVDDVADHYAFSYVDFLERNRDRFGQAIAAVADEPGTVVIHCMGGKDRTGLVAALLLRLAGVALDDIGRDYALSGPNLAARTASWLDSAPNEAERRRREKLSETPATAMARVIEEVERRFGGVDGYLGGGGVRPDQIDRLRARLR